MMKLLAFLFFTCFLIRTCTCGGVSCSGAHIVWIDEFQATQTANPHTVYVNAKVALVFYVPGTSEVTLFDWDTSTIQSSLPNEFSVAATTNQLDISGVPLSTGSYALAFTCTMPQCTSNSEVNLNLDLNGELPQ
jgi:hypothetical protein